MEETGWICSQCGEFNTRTTVCTRCGNRPAGSPTTPKMGPVRRRVSEAEVAHILSLVADPPNFRERPKDGDTPGRYQAWFDGGALRIDTGTKTYFLADGTRIWVLAPVMWLSLVIEFPNGERVVVEQLRGTE